MSINVIKKNKVGSSKNESIRKSGNKLVEILAKSKSRNLPKFRFANLLNSINLIDV